MQISGLQGCLTTDLTNLYARQHVTAKDKNHVQKQNNLKTKGLNHSFPSVCQRFRIAGLVQPKPHTKSSSRFGYVEG